MRSPKLYFYDVGLATYINGYRVCGQISTHHLRGALFENMVVMGVLKYRFNCGKQSNLFRSYSKKGVNDGRGVKMGMMADYCMMNVCC